MNTPLSSFLLSINHANKYELDVRVITFLRCPFFAQKLGSTDIPICARERKTTITKILQIDPLLTGSLPSSLLPSYYKLIKNGGDNK